MQLFPVFYICLLVLIIGSTPFPLFAATTSVVGVDVVNSNIDCSDAGTDNYCTNLTVTCEGLPLRKVEIKIRRPSTPKGAVVFFTGSTGTRFYGENGGERAVTLADTRTNGFETFEVKWRDSNGWWTVPDAGYERALCGAAKVLEWINAEGKSATHNVMCSMGSSGGSMQQAYPLALYGVDSFLDLALLSDGPPTSDLKRGCGFVSCGTPNPCWPATAPSRINTDSLQNWSGVGTSCKSPSKNPGMTVLREAEDDSLVSPTRIRNYYHPMTRVHFLFSSADNTNAQNQGAIYRAQVINAGTVTSTYTISSAIHGADSVTAGALQVRSWIKSYCKNNP